jgi:hypothetical protein
MPPNLFIQIFCPSPKALDLDEKRLHWASVVTLFENENERQKTESVPIPLSRAAGSCFEAKK